jgi:hypothetical protein
MQGSGLKGVERGGATRHRLQRFGPGFLLFRLLSLSLWGNSVRPPLFVQSGSRWLLVQSSGVECLLPLLIEADPHNYAGPDSPDPGALGLDLDPVTTA